MKWKMIELVFYVFFVWDWTFMGVGLELEQLEKRKSVGNEVVFYW